MGKPFSLKSLTDNGISVTQVPNLSRQSINLVFENGEKYELLKPATLTEGPSKFVWKDDSQPKIVGELHFSEYSRARGNPLLTFEQVTYLSQINSKIDEILYSYSEQ